MAELPSSGVSTLSKAPTGIHGLDEITGGGLPRGRPTLICGSAGCGKTLLSVEFLVRGVMEFDEPGVFMSFEESAEEIAANVRSLGYDLDELQDQGKLRIDHVHVERSEISETGEYDLEGLFIRLGYAIDSIGARRVVLDTIEALFGSLTDLGILRAELRRLFRWLKDKGVTAVITGEQGDGRLTRHGLEEYVSDCAILLDHRVTEQISTRRMRIVKYRGTSHGTNEYPFIIDEKGITVMPITSLGLAHDAPLERISSGVPELDAMLGGDGYYRGSSILLSGTAGTGKSSMAAAFAECACRNGEKALYFAFEESPAQILRNMGSIGIELRPWIEQGLLEVHSARPTLQGLEMHLANLDHAIRKSRPTVVVIDPITNLLSAGLHREAHSMILRLVDFLKQEGITALMVSLTSGQSATLEQTDVAISSLIDTWLLLRDIESNGERNRGLYILKSRGMGHSNQIREFVLDSDGIHLIEPYIGPEGVLTGTLRKSQEAREEAEKLLRVQETQRIQCDLDRRRRLLENQIEALRLEYEVEEEKTRLLINEARHREEQLAEDREIMARIRGGGNGESVSRTPAG
jgi:circadian clock protein KaiC